MLILVIIDSRPASKRLSLLFSLVCLETRAFRVRDASINMNKPYLVCWPALTPGGDEIDFLKIE